MKLLINYDFFDAIRNVNEPLTPMKIVRNSSYKYALLAPLNISLGMMYYKSPEYILQHLVFCYGFYITTDFAFDYYAKKNILDDMDRYAYAASNKLKKLSVMFDNINVKTNKTTKKNLAKFIKILKKEKCSFCNCLKNNQLCLII